jgi:hypothetical protein
MSPPPISDAQAESLTVVGQHAAGWYHSGMLLQIQINSETETRLRENAAAAGKDVFVYASELVEQAVAGSNLDAILAPLRRHFEAVGTTDDELIQDITDAQAEYRSEQHKKTA